MKIKYAIFGSDNNPLYLDFWPVVSKVWKEKFNITPVLGLVGNDKSDLYEDNNGIVVKVKIKESQDLSFSSQIVRMYLIKYLDGMSIISDIDMIPLSKKYFIDQFVNFSEQDIFILSSHHPQTSNINQYPMCYVVGDSNKLSNIFNSNVSWDEFYNQIPKNGWYSDQIYLHQCMLNYGKEKIKFPYRSFNNDRIDRSFWSYDLNKLKNEEYIDSHLLRPYYQYKKQIDDLINLI